MTTTRVALVGAVAIVAIVAVASSGCGAASRVGGGPAGGSADSAVGIAAIDFYRDVLSEQWGFHCDFEPSCSSFGRQAVRDYGLLPGTLMVADRLQRDHGLARGRYPRTRDGRPLDPVAANALFDPRERLPLVDDPADDPEDPDGALGVERPPVDSAASLRRFADGLFADTELARAAIEYRRYLFHFPQGEDAEHCRQRRVLALAGVGRTDAALRALDAVSEGSARDLLRASVLRADGRLPAAAAAAPTETPEGLLYGGFVALEAGDVATARRRLDALGPKAGPALLAECDRFAELPSRSPALAATASALIPGSGQIYAGRVADGVVAFLLNGTLIGATVVAAANDEEVTAAALGTVAFGFYTGNVYGGANAARRHDIEERERFLTGLRGRVRQNRVRFGIAPRDDGGVIGLYFDF